MIQELSERNVLDFGNWKEEAFEVFKSVWSKCNQVCSSHDEGKDRSVWITISTSLPPFLVITDERALLFLFGCVNNRELATDLEDGGG